MRWQDNLHLDGKGSFREIEFFVSSTSSTVGRRTVEHSYPGQDKPYVEDMGRAARKFKLDAYVLGSNYMAERDKLRRAFETAGSGRLVHPYWGSFDATIDGQVEITETTDNGGMARFTLNVIEAGTEKFDYIIESTDTLSKVTSAADAANAAVASAFATLYAAVDAIEFVRDTAVAIVDTATSTLNRVAGVVSAAMNSVNTLADSIEAMGDEVAALVLLPSQLAGQMQGNIAGVLGAIDSIGDAWDTYFDDSETPGTVSGTPLTSATGATVASGDERSRVLMTTFRDLQAFGADFDEIEITTPSRQQEYDTQKALIDLVRATATIETARVAADMPYASYDQAAAVRDELGDALDTLMETAEDEAYNALATLRADLATHLSSTSASLPRLVTFTPARSLPALVIAQQLYGDSTRDTEIIDRNDVRNPCLVPASVTLSVLSDD